MSFFEFDSNTPESKTHTIWTEKYRPAKLDDYIGNDEFKKCLHKIIDTNDLSHLMLHGPAPGTGKTTAAKLIVNSIKCDYIYLNCSNTNGIDDVRTKIESFASSMALNELKVVICDESDQFSIPAQSSLKAILEMYALTTRFIFTCNNISRILPAIESRCQTFHIVPPSKKDVAIRLKYVLDNEQIKYSMQDIGYIVNTYYPDIRKILNYSQQNVVDGSLILSDNTRKDVNIKNKLLELLESKPKTAYIDIKQLIANYNIRQFDEYYRLLYENTSKFCKNDEGLAVIVIADYMHHDVFSPDKEIPFMACISRILSEF